MISNKIKIERADIGNEHLCATCVYAHYIQHSHASAKLFCTYHSDGGNLIRIGEPVYSCTKFRVDNSSYFPDAAATKKLAREALFMVPIGTKNDDELEENPDPNKDKFEFVSYKECRKRGLFKYGSPLASSE